MSGHDETIRRIAGLVGIAARYRDQHGRTLETTADTQRAVLAGLGLAVESEGEARDTLARVDALKNGLVPLLIPVESGRAAPVRLGGIRDGSVTWRLQE